jgi:hypothetical protein
MKNLMTISATILYILTGCGESKQSSNDFITVDVTAKYPNKELILQDFMDVEYVPLETTDEFITSARIRAIGKDIMIFTNMRRDGDIFIFDRSGKGLRKINRQGQGGEEYVNIQGVVLDEEKNEMYVNSTFSNQMLTYDLEGNFKGSFRYRYEPIYDQTGNFDREHLICHDFYIGVVDGIAVDTKRNCFMLVSKQDGSIREIPIPYNGEKKTEFLMGTDANGELTDRGIRSNRDLIPYRDSWILTEISADTIYSYSPDHRLKPFIIRTPSVQSMTPEVYLYPGVLTDRYYFMQTVKREYNFVTEEGFPRTDLVYDTQEKALFECTVYNDDYVPKRPTNMVYEIPTFPPDK